MPRNLSAWVDACVHLATLLALVLVLSYYNTYVASIAFVVWLLVALFARERCRARKLAFDTYCRDVVRNVSEVTNFAIERLPQAVVIVNPEGRIAWTNSIAKEYLGENPEPGLSLKDFWPGIILEPIWGASGEYVFAHEAHYYKVRYRPIVTSDDIQGLMALYVEDWTEYEEMRIFFKNSRAVLAYIQIDNFDEVMQGLSEAERTALLFEANRRLDEWLKGLGGFMRRVSDDLYVAVLERKSLDRAIEEHFDILDRVRNLQSTNRLPLTLSMGLAVAEEQSMEELGREAQAGLDLALGRGGDQVAVRMGGKNQFFGGKAKAVEKHTRVKARVVAHAVREIIENADEVFIMGHHNEDFDCFGAAIGVAKMAHELKKPVHIVLSDMNEGIDKLTDLLRDAPEYEGLLIRAEDLETIDSLNPVLFVVDTHIPHLVAAPVLLERIAQVIVIDHHRRSGESFIKSPLLVYIEPASSSTSELVTELLMYFSDDLVLSRLAATALYSGIVVDTKNFTVQTGIRTFEAAAYLRRGGADPVVVRHLFRADFDTEKALSAAKAGARLFPGGLITARFPAVIPNVQAIAGQVADALLRIEGVRMSLVFFQLDADTVGISARSTGELNMQVIMESFGGGGHQNVAGAQVKGEPLASIEERAIAISEKHIEENDKDESDIAAGRQEGRKQG